MRKITIRTMLILTALCLPVSPENDKIVPDKMFRFNLDLDFWHKRQLPEANRLKIAYLTGEPA